jgi:hypothetical protein
METVTAKSQRGLRRGVLRASAAAVLVLVGFSAYWAPTAVGATTMKTSVDATWQTNGRVQALVTVGTVTYLGGSFTSVRPAGTLAGDPATKPRAHLAAIDNTTGAVLAWNPGADGLVRALAASPDGSIIYAGGDFNTAGGQARHRVAALNRLTGAATAFNVSTNNTVTALAAASSRLYLGGSFTTVAGLPRQRLAAVSVGGVLDSAWKPAADNTVRALQVSPDNLAVYAGGMFGSINANLTQKKLVKLNPTTGAVMPWSSHPTYPVLAIAATSANVYVGGDGSGGHATAYTKVGARLWQVQTDGAVQAVAITYPASLTPQVYIGGHFDNVCVGNTVGPTTGFTCPTISATRHKLLAVDATTAALKAWAPNPNSVNGVWALETQPTKLEVGGDFTSIGANPRTAQQGFAQFS